MYRYDGADGLKTGHTEASGYGLAASVSKRGRRLLLVVNGLDSQKQRPRETERLLDWAFREFDNYALFSAGETVANADIWLGTGGSGSTRHRNRRNPDPAAQVSAQDGG